jgi:glyoxylase-like metal-dependent hydrolase (beta-lactamase superfamily II)
MEVRHFGPVTFIPGEKDGRYPFCHSIYIEGGGVLIDPASNRKRLVELRKNFKIEEIWLSHWHEDHIMHLDLFDDLPLRITEPDAGPLADLDGYIDSYGEVTEAERKFWRTFLTERFHFAPRTPARFLKSGETVQMDTVTVEIIGSPGHTPGHISLFFPEPMILFLADYDLTPFGPWYGDVHSSIEQTRDSVKHLREIPAKIWLTCHEKGIFETDPGNLWDDYLGVIDTRENKILDLLDTPQTLTELAGACIVYGKPREPREFHDLGERGHMIKHLEKLINEGAVAKEGETYVKI